MIAHHEVVIDSSIQSVASVLSRFDNYFKAIDPGVVSIKPVTDGEVQAGSVFIERRKFGPFRITLSAQYTVYDLPHRIAHNYFSPGLIGSTSMRLAEAEDGKTRFSVTTTSVPVGLAWLGFPFFSWYVKRQVRSRTELLKKLIESGDLRPEEATASAGSVD